MPLRELTEDDLELILPWRNAPAVRQAMFHHHEITLDEHWAWFRALENDPSRRWYIFEDEQLRPQGVVYFTDINPQQETAFWGFYARPGAPAGTGIGIFLGAIDLAFEELAIYKLSGEVLAYNERSINLHKKAGFQEEGRFRAQHRDGEQRNDVVRLGLLKEDWQKHRAHLKVRLLERRDTDNHGL